MYVATKNKKNKKNPKTKKPSILTFLITSRHMGWMILWLWGSYQYRDQAHCLYYSETRAMAGGALPTLPVQLPLLPGCLKHRGQESKGLLKREGRLSAFLEKALSTPVFSVLVWSMAAECLSAASCEQVRIDANIGLVSRRKRAGQS